MENIFYIKSLSGQVYKVSSMPKFSKGFEVVDEEEFIKQCEKFGLDASKEKPLAF